jgi:hypothetical protein
MGGFSYPDEFIFEADPMPQTVGSGVMAVFAIIYFSILFVSIAFSVATYVLHSIGLHAIAKRRGIRNGWLAWLPVGNLWILGNISDQYQYVAKGKVKNRRRTLLGISIILFVGYFPWLFATLLKLASGKETVALLLLAFGGLTIFALAIWLCVCQYMAYYDLFRSCEPNNAVLYLVLSIVFSVTLPFFVFVCRNRDLGMPPRRKSAAQQVVVPTVEVVVDPNVVEQVVVPTVEPVMEEGYAQPEEFEDE